MMNRNALILFVLCFPPALKPNNKITESQLVAILNRPKPDRLLGSPLAGTGHRGHAQSGNESETASGFPAVPSRKADGGRILCVAAAPGTYGRATTPPAPESDRRNPPTVHGWCYCHPTIPPPRGFHAPPHW